MDKKFNWSNRTDLNATEKAKLEKDGLDVINDVGRFAEQGLQALTAADYDRLKWLEYMPKDPRKRAISCSG